MRIELRFALLLILCSVLGVAAAGGVSYSLAFDQARTVVAERARVLLASALAARQYTADEVAPLAGAGGEAFHPQTVPSYGAQTVIAGVTKSFPEYKYREVSLNPTNVADRATDWEVGLFRAFAADKGLSELSGVADARDSFYIARPLWLEDGACLACHSTPEAAPKAMIARYGGGNGFNWKLGDLIGLQIVEVPVGPSRRAAWRSVAVSIGALACVLVVTASVFLLLLRRYVVRPLRRVTEEAASISLGRAPPPQPAALDPPFREMQRALDRMKASLEEAIAALRPGAARDS